MNRNDGKLALLYQRPDTYRYIHNLLLSYLFIHSLHFQMFVMTHVCIGLALPWEGRAKEDNSTQGKKEFISSF